MPPGVNSIGRTLIRAAGVSALAAMAFALAACGDDSSDDQANCRDPSTIQGFTPPGQGAPAFTMGIRVQRPGDVNKLAAGIGSRLSERDVFVIDTEHPNTDAELWESTLHQASEKFPCNRIFDLVGLGRRADRPSYQFALVSDPELDGILVDWESLSWNGTGRGPWTASLERNLPRIRQHLDQIADQLKGRETRVGLAPQYLPPWDYGRTAAVVAAANVVLDPSHRGYQVIQTQTNCGKPLRGGPPIPQLTPRLLAQYRAVFGQRVPIDRADAPLLTNELLQHLGLEISFTTSPNPSSSDAELRIGTKQAAACTEQILRAGGAGILYWASPGSIRALLETPTGRRLRPPA